MTTIKLRLYVSGKTMRTERTIANLHRILDDEADAEYELDVCDVLEAPQTAEKDKVLATPTLMLISPPPARRIVGDLADTARVLQYLGIATRGDAQEKNDA